MLKNFLVFTGDWVHISPDFIEVNFPQFRNGWNYALCYACSVTFKKRCLGCNSGNCVNFFNNAKFNLFCICHIFCLCDIQFSSVQSLSRVRVFVNPWIAECQASLSITNSRSSPKLMHIKSVMPSSHLILCRPSSCPQFLPASETFPMSQLFAWGGQSTGVSALASFLPKKSQGWSPLEWTGWISYRLAYNMLVTKCLLRTMITVWETTFPPRMASFLRKVFTESSLSKL